MTRQGIRYSPPAVEVPPEVDWLLSWALAKHASDLVDANRVEAGRLDRIVGATGLLGRIRSRWPRELLASELSQGLFDKVGRAIHSIAANEVIQEEAALRIAEIASEQGISAVFLKGMALRLGGYAAAGTRQAGDIDVLVPHESAEPLSEALRQKGCRELDLRQPDYHLLPLVHPLGVVIEIHHFIEGVSLGSTRGVTAEEILAGENYRELEGWPAGNLVPDANLLTAHLLVHALGQHGFSPGSYPLLQLLADLQDLDFSGAPGDRFVDEGFEWIQKDMTQAEVAGTRNLLQRLESGEGASIISSGIDSPALILRHLLAGALDAEYRQSLKLASLSRSSSAAWSPRRVLRGLRSSIALSRGQIDQIYGKPETELGYLGWRLWRPFDLVGRMLKTFWAQWKMRSR